jgi:4a-hydroxytetrahydrobiopterin dehydratase
MPASTDSGALNAADIERRLNDLPQWRWVDKALVRVQSFPSFRSALDFVYQVGLAAEENDHHPDIVMNYKRVEVRYWTHTAGGVTPLDFKMAGLVEELVGRFGGTTSPK